MDPFTEENNLKSPLRIELLLDYVAFGRKSENHANGKRAIDVGVQVFHDCHQ